MGLAHDGTMRDILKYATFVSVCGEEQATLEIAELAAPCDRQNEYRYGSGWAI